MAKPKKSTIKFQKNKLKQTVERRKKNAQFKKQVARRQQRRTGPSATGKESRTEENIEEQENSTETETNVDEYFCGYVMESEEPLDLSDDEEKDLDVLDEFKAIEADETGVENQDGEDINEDQSDEDDEMDEDMEESDDMDDEEEGSEEDADSQIVSSEILAKWCSEADQKSPTALKHLLLAFRGVARSDDDVQSTYRVQSSKVYTKLVRKTLKMTYPILSQHIYLTKKVRHPAKTKNWSKLEKVVRLFLNNCVRLLRDMEQDEMVEFTLNELEPSIPYFGCFPKAAREYLRVLLDKWSDVALSCEVRAQCYKAIRLLATTAIDVEKRSYLSHALKGTYLVTARRATKINETSFPVIQQLYEEAADLYAIEPKLSYQHADVYIRQLADHLKKAKKAQTVEAFKSIYTWQFISCLDFWVNVVAATCDPAAGTASPMQEIIHPLVELSLHTLRLNPTASFLPLRAHIIRTLVGMIDATGFYIPLAPYLFDILDTDVFKGHGAQTELAPFDWDLHLKTPKSYMDTKTYQDAVYQMMYDGIVDFYACLGLSIAFPELAIPAIDKLKVHQRRMKGTRFVKSLRTLIEKLETHKNYIEQKRAPIEYGPNKLDEATSFLRNTAFEQTPFGNFLKKKAQST
ncbi:Nucleolar Complex 2 protein [Apophysomyces sp. BC1034]|nr:Nucleolar Complex 2 protein [Apophysomyces sp. BC1015]KAG0177349.1 Nucleolar Complex 2 protein [Apophysomyces sp. BC1021]KAG0187648.1 Nucleolar Complex 2 protein [Apophysomyces sp. BC1034]